MKTFLFLMTLVSLTFFAACGESSSGPSCAEVCDKMVECQIESDLTECTSMCDAFRDAMRPAAYQALGDCYMEQTCAFLQENDDYCFGQAMNEGDLAAVDRLFDRMCAKIVPCVDNPEYTEQACIDELTGAGEGSDDMYYSLSLLKASALDCLGDCVEATTCADLGDEEWFTTCSSSCGLGFMVEGSDR